MTSTVDFPIVSDTRIQGGWHTAVDLAARDRIPTERRKLGMRVRVVSVSTTYELVGGLDNTHWVAVAEGGGGITRGALHLTSPLPAEISIAQIRANNLITLADTTVYPSAPYVESAHESSFPSGLGGKALWISVGLYAPLGTNPGPVVVGVLLPASPDPLTAAAIMTAVNAAGPYIATVVGGKVHIESTSALAVWISIRGTAAAALGFPASLQWAENRGAGAYIESRLAGAGVFPFPAGGTLTFDANDSGFYTTIPPGTYTAATLAAILCADGVGSGCSAWQLSEGSGSANKRIVLAADPRNPADPPISRGGDTLTYTSESPAGITGFPIGIVHGVNPLFAEVSIASGSSGDDGLDFHLTKSAASTNDISIVGTNFADPPEPGMGLGPLQFLWDGVSKWYWS